MEYPMQWVNLAVRYLGIWVSRDVDELWRENYGRAVAWFEDRLPHWIRLPLSLLGRVAILKMLVLPKFLIPLHRAFFTRL